MRNQFNGDFISGDGMFFPSLIIERHLYAIFTYSFKKKRQPFVHDKKMKNSTGIF